MWDAQTTPETFSISKNLQKENFFKDIFGHATDVQFLQLGPTFEKNKYENRQMRK